MKSFGELILLLCETLKMIAYEKPVSYTHLEWKENVLRNQAIRKVTLPINKQASHKLVITALDEGMVLDQVILY